MGDKYEGKFGASEKGVGNIIQVGELFPWKGIMWRVIAVRFDEIDLEDIKNPKNRITIKAVAARKKP
jgi:hypothetical protein